MVADAHGELDEKSELIDLIKKILVEQDIMTQDDLVNALLDLNIEVTQLLVSRDMRESLFSKSTFWQKQVVIAMPCLKVIDSIQMQSFFNQLLKKLKNKVINWRLEQALGQLCR